MAEKKALIRLVPDQAETGPSGLMAKKTAHQIDAEAAGWAARVDRGRLGPDDEQAFQDWLRGDARCAGAFARLRALVLTTERARALGPDFDPETFGRAPPL